MVRFGQFRKFGVPRSKFVIPTCIHTTKCQWQGQCCVAWLAKLHEKCTTELTIVRIHEIKPDFRGRRSRTYNYPNYTGSCSISWLWLFRRQLAQEFLLKSHLISVSGKRRNCQEQGRPNLPNNPTQFRELMPCHVACVRCICTVGSSFSLVAF